MARNGLKSKPLSRLANGCVGGLLELYVGALRLHPLKDLQGAQRSSKSGVLALESLHSGATDANTHLLPRAIRAISFLRKIVSKDAVSQSIRCAADGELATVVASGLEAVAPILVATSAAEGSASGQQHTDGLLARNAYSAACALVSAAQLRSKGAAVASSGDVCSQQSFSILWPACNSLLQRNTYCKEDPGDILLREDELAWVSSAMSAVGRDLSVAGRHDLAHSPLWVAFEAGLAAAVVAGTASPDKEVLEERVMLAARRGAAVAECCVARNEAHKGLHVVAGCLNLWAELGFTSGPMVQPLVQAAVSIRSAGIMSTPASSTTTPSVPQAAAIDRLPSMSSLAAPCMAAQRDRHRSSVSDSCAALLSARVELSGALGLALPTDMLGAVLREEVSEWMRIEAEGGARVGIMCWQEAEQALEALVEVVHPRDSDLRQHAQALVFRARCRLCHAAQTCTPEASSSCGIGSIDLIQADLADADVLLQSQPDEGTASDSAAVHTMLALQLAAVARRARTNAKPAANEIPEDPSVTGEKVWAPAVEARRLAADRLASSYSADAAAAMRESEPEGVTSDDLLQMMMELRYLAALQGSPGEQQQLSSVILATALAQQDGLSDGAMCALENLPAGCAMGLLFAPHIHPSLMQDESTTSQPFSLASLRKHWGGCTPSAEHLRQVAADAAEQLGKESSSRLQRGFLHLLAAAQAHREGDTIRGLHDATEALRLTSAIALPTGELLNAGGCGQAFAGEWRALWQYLGCLLQCGDLYEAMEAFDDAQHAFKEGLRLSEQVEAGICLAAFAVRLAHVYAKQHRWPDADAQLARAASALEGPEGGGGTSPAAALVWGDLRRVSGDVSRRQGAPEQALEHYQTAAEHMLRALEAVASADGAENSGRQRGGGGRQGRGSRAKGRSRSEQSESSGCIHCQWPLIGLVARVRVQQAACQIALGDGTAARGHLDAARGACETERVEAAKTFPWQIAAADYHRALLLEGEQAGVDAQEASVWGCAAAQGCTQDVRLPAPQPSSRKGRGRKGTAVHKEAPAAATPKIEDIAMQQLTLLVEAYLLSRHLPGLSRKVAGMLSVVCGRLGLLHAAALFLYASLGTSVGAQYAAIAESKLNSGRRKGRHAAGAADGAAQLAAMGRARAALRLDSFDDARLRVLLADAASGQAPVHLFQYLEEDAKLHMDRSLLFLPAGTPVCSISMHPTLPGQWLLSRCETGALPIIVQLPVMQQEDGMSAAEELEAIMEDSAASMRGEGERDTKAQKAAWWRARLALDERLKLLLHRLQACLDPWTCLMLGARRPLPSEAAVKSLAACLQQLDPVGSWPSVLRQVFTAIFWAGEALGRDQLLAAAQQLCCLLGHLEQETTASQMVLEIRRHCAADAAHTRDPCDGLSNALDSLSLDTALTDISNTLTAASSGRGKKQVALKARRGRPATAAALPDLQEADCIVRCFETEAADGTDAVSEHEADCILRAAPPRAAARRSQGRNVESPEAESADTGTEVADTDSEGELPVATVTAAKSARTLRLGRYKDSGSRQENSTVDTQTPKAPAPSGRGCAVVDENAVIATPAQRTTVRRASRFAAMQAPAAAAPLTELPRRAPARAAAPSTAAQPLRSRPVENDQNALPRPAGKRGKSRVSFAAKASPEPGLHMPSLQLQTAARKKPTCGGARKSSRKVVSVAVLHSDAAKDEAGRAGEASCKGTPFVIHRAPDLGDVEGEVGELGAHMRALALEGDCLGGPSHQSASGGQATGPVLLVLDGELQSLPWESLPALQQQRIYRAPSLACACAIAARNAKDCTPSLCADSSWQASSDACSAEQHSIDGPKAVDVHDAVYMLNPSGDLASTQATFQEFFQQQPGWQGSVGAPGLPAAELAAALTQRQAFVYCGHGGGQQHLPGRALRRLPRCAASLLMGCSSGRLTRTGTYAPSGPVLAYLLAGCPTAVANLWDVTDRDIDRFAMALLRTWLPDNLIGGPPGNTDGGLHEGLCISGTVAQSRSFCRLPHLIGAAPVCYGIPAIVKNI
ncbi:probable separin at C-terminar half [Coccomyxa sp. Obi]|nr:probable separin at C-terminar half [Coccomyxa sp. Obi]